LNQGIFAWPLTLYKGQSKKQTVHKRANKEDRFMRTVFTQNTGLEKTKMNQLKNTKDTLLEEETFKGGLEDLRRRLASLKDSLSGLNQCSHLSKLLQKIYKIREGLNNLEQGLLQTHLKGCISPTLKVPEVVALSVSKLSRKRRGGTIVIEQEDNLDDHFQGGVFIDAVVSVTILENIFYPGSPLHDGAVLIRNARIIKAGCLLPFAPHPHGFEALGLGTRHAAAVGLSRASDALVIVVSEEKGWISLALRGQLYPNLGTFALLQRLEGSIEEAGQSITQ
jgi:DNA integrity scanning protein DisA with diadenylate cyclase activity